MMPQASDVNNRGWNPSADGWNPWQGKKRPTYKPCKGDIWLTEILQQQGSLNLMSPL
ncbi:MAG: hypothetical protein MUC78_10140 [Bacteroidales bacterium]|nr:hypothetical protein [Bacteroidales bacterium]